MPPAITPSKTEARLSRPVQVAEAIKDWVVEQGLRAGDRLPNEQELIDRFGPLPKEVETLLRVVAVKVLCKHAGIEKIDAGPKGAVIHFRGKVFVDPAGLVQHLSKHQALFKARPDSTLVLRIEQEDPEIRLRSIERHLAPLADIANSARAQG